MITANDSSWPGWERLSPVLLYANFYDAKPGGGFGPRYVQGFQMLIVQSGCGSAQIGDDHLSIAGGDVLFYGPHQRHAVRSSRGDPLHLIGLFFLFCQADAERIDSDVHAQLEPFVFPGEPLCCPLDPPPPPKTSPFVTSQLQTHCESLVLSYIAAPTGRQMEKRGLLLLVFETWHDVMRAKGQSVPAAHRRAITRAQETILQSLAHPPSPVQLAETAGLHPDYFTRLFKQQTGLSVQGFVTQQRLLRARRLLVEARLKVSDVAGALGFNDPYYFSRLFTRQFGIAPSVFRREYALQ